MPIERGLAYQLGYELKLRNIISKLAVNRGLLKEDIFCSEEEITSARLFLYTWESDEKLRNSCSTTLSLYKKLAERMFHGGTAFKTFFLYGSAGNAQQQVLGGDCTYFSYPILLYLFGLSMKDVDSLINEVFETCFNAYSHDEKEQDVDFLRAISDISYMLGVKMVDYAETLNMANLRFPENPVSVPSIVQDHFINSDTDSFKKCFDRIVSITHNIYKSSLSENVKRVPELMPIGKALINADINNREFRKTYVYADDFFRLVISRSIMYGIVLGSRWYNDYDIEEVKNQLLRLPPNIYVGSIASNRLNLPPVALCLVMENIYASSEAEVAGAGTVSDFYAPIALAAFQTGISFALNSY